MNLNTSNLSHPRMQWEIESAMWRAKDYSLDTGVGIACVRSAAGEHVLGVMHDRQAIPAFSFWKGGKDVTGHIIKALRSFQ